jgi:hypothetical protein
MSDIDSYTPSSGRMLRENGEVVNLADLWSDIVAGAGVVKPTNYLYVSKGGNDTTGDGSANFPYLTIQKAIDTATSGTTIFPFPGTYTENLTLKAGVNITSPVKFGVYIIGNHIANFTGTIIFDNVVLSSSTGNTLSFSGTGAQNLQFLGSSVNSTSGDAINWTNTNTSSKIYFEDGTCNVSTSGSSARCVYTASTAKGSLIANRVSFKLDNPNNVCIALGGSVSFTHTSDQIIGQVTVADSASATIAIVAMITTSVAVLNTVSTGTVTLINNSIATTATPAFTGTGILAYTALVYTSTGVGGASTLSGGLGPIALAMSSIKLRASALVPNEQIASGQSNGLIEFDGTHFYGTIGTTRSILL